MTSLKPLIIAAFATFKQSAEAVRGGLKMAKASEELIWEIIELTYDIFSDDLTETEAVSLLNEIRQSRRDLKSKVDKILGR